MADAKHGSGLAVHFDVAALDPQHRRCGVARLRTHLRRRANRKSSSKKVTARQHEKQKPQFAAARAGRFPNRQD
jgi:hypothetical protein